MPDLSTLKPCSVEVFRRSIPGRISIWSYVTEVPNADVPDPDPLDIIAWDQDYVIHVKIEMPDPVRRHLCGTLCVDVDVDTCGPAPDKQFPEKEVPLNPCGDGLYYVDFPLPAGTFTDDSNRCGRVYRICITVGSHDPCGKPGLIWAHCDSVEIAVHPPVPVP